MGAEPAPVHGAVCCHAPRCRVRPGRHRGPVQEPGLQPAGGSNLLSVLQRKHLARVVAVAAMEEIVTLPYSGSASVFLSVLIDKKYVLPYPTLEALVKFFVSFRTETRTLPLMWQRSLLTLVQRYKTDMYKEEKADLKQVSHMHSHPMINKEIHRELDTSACRERSAGATENK